MAVSNTYKARNNERLVKFLEVPVSKRKYDSVL
jgi:hypothetical protein